MEKPTMRQRIDGLGKFIYNSEEGTILGRGGKSWGEIGLFYLIYYICLSGFFAATIAVFYQTIDSDKPALMGSSSLLKGNPGLGLIPRHEGNVISIKSPLNAKDQKNYADKIDKVLEPYKKTGLPNIPCGTLKEPRPGSTIPCAVDLDNLTSVCNTANSYGMADNTPCIMMKLNKVYGWIPDMWDAGSLKGSGLPDEVQDIYNPHQIWLHCKGRKSEDEKKLKGATIDYYPMQGFPAVYFPFENQENYLNPLVFVRFSNLSSTTVKIECRTYAKNIEFDRTEKQGGVEFDLTVA